MGRFFAGCLKNKMRGMLAAIFLVMATLVVAAEPTGRQIVPADAAVVVEINRPLAVLDNPLFRDLWAILNESTEFQKGRGAYDVDRLVQAVRFFETTYGVDWRQGVEALTAGGIVVALQAGKDAAVMAVVTCDQAKTALRLLDTAHDLIRKQAGQNANNVIQSTRYRERDCYKLGELYYSVTGSQVLLSNKRAGLESMLDRADQPVAAYDPPAGNREPLLRVTGNVKVLRDDPKFQKGLKLPAEDANAVALLGGYLDLLRRGDAVVAEVWLNEQAIDLSLRVNAGSQGMLPALRGFFAATTNATAAVPLQPSNAIFTASWYHDYSALWNVRTELLDAERIKRAEDENAKQVAAGQVGILDVVKLLGPHYRLVVIPQTENIYRFPLTERLPAAAIAVDVLNEGSFREQVIVQFEKFLKTPIAMFIGSAHVATHREATLTSLRLRDDPQAAAEGGRIKYSFNPCYTLTRGHFVLGSTEEVVRAVVDELERAATPQAAEESSTAGHVTDYLWLSLERAAKEIDGFQDRIVRGAVFGQGLSITEANHEIDVFRRFLVRIGGIKSRTTIGPDIFEIQARIGHDEQP